MVDLSLYASNRAGGVVWCDERFIWVQLLEDVATFRQVPAGMALNPNPCRFRFQPKPFYLSSAALHTTSSTVVLIQ